MLEAGKCIQNEIPLCVSLWFPRKKNQREECRAAGGGQDGVLLEDGAAAGVRISGRPVHGDPHAEGLGVGTLSGSLPLPVQAPQRYGKKKKKNKKHLL